MLVFLRSFIDNILMRHSLFSILVFILTCLFSNIVFSETKGANELKALEFEITGQISTPQYQITKRALAHATETNADVVIINMDTPGGDLATTLDMMELISNYKGHIICFVNPNAASAGSYIATSCDEIWFAPRGIMGAAEAVSSNGEDIGESMKRKLDSFLSAKVKAISQNAESPNPNIAKVQKAMANPDYELKFGDEILKKSGELLTLTSQEAVKIYDGFPLLANGIAQNTRDLLNKAYPNAKKIDIEKLELSWFEKFAKYISAFSPILMGIGVFLLIIEFKTAGFGVFGILGIGILALVFFGSNAAGLTGYEAPIIFAIGVLMLVLELFVLPGFFVFGILGIALISISLVMVGASPIPTSGFSGILDAIAVGVGKFAIALVIAFLLLYLLKPFLKSTPLWRKLVLEGGQKNELENLSDMGLVGQSGVAITDLIPNGKVKVLDSIFDASSKDGSCIQKNTKIKVKKVESFGLKVERIS